MTGKLVSVLKTKRGKWFLNRDLSDTKRKDLNPIIHGRLRIV